MAPKRSAKIVAVKTRKKVVQETVQVAVIQTTKTQKQQQQEESKQQGKQPLKSIVVEEKSSTAEEENQSQKNVKDPKGATTTTTTTSQKQEAAQEGAENKKSGTRRGRRRRSEGGEGYRRYVYRVMKQVHPGMGISSKAMTILNNLMSDMFERLVEEASKLTKYTGRVTLTSREIQGAARLVLPGDLGRHAIAEGIKAVTTYISNNSTGDPNKD